MYYFHNDYNRMCHPAVLNKFNQLQELAMPGYGTDDCCTLAQKLIRKLCKNESLSAHFLVGGTQANLVVIDAALRSHQAAVCAVTGHINVHETGAVEATGHKVIGLPTVDGKITADQIEAVAVAHLTDGDREHIAQPKLVYISNSTELGTIYYLDELEAISGVCKKYGYYLFLDGARLGYALAASDNDITFADLARLCDVFYIGLTKVGAMFGEAVVISNPAIDEDFRYLMKQRGGMLAKGWLLGIQFEALFEDGLYMQIAAQADQYANQIRAVLEELGYPLFVPGTTNQIFPVLPDAILPKLEKEITFVPMDRVDETHRAVRFCTSWATTQADVDVLCNILRKASK